MSDMHNCRSCDVRGWKAWAARSIIFRAGSRVGTRYVIEGRGGLIRLRYLEFPDGHKVDLPADSAARTKPPRRCRQAPKQPQPGAKKNEPGRNGVRFGELS
jgi:hypothetical protein